MAKQLVYITGSGRCGSTLLDLMLNNHSMIQSTGEVNRLNLYAQNNPQPCTCGVAVLECPFWLRVQQEAQQETGVGPEAPLLKSKDMLFKRELEGRLAGFLQRVVLVSGVRWLYRLAGVTIGRRQRQAALNSLFWIEMIRRAAGCPIVVDSSKGAARLKALYMADPKRMKVIYLVRDGRAVAASEMRRKDRTMEAAANYWRTANRHSLLALRGIPEGQILRLRYETLCTTPAEVMRETCDFLGIPFEEGMLALRKQEAHNIGGNPMRFRKQEATIKLDERWRDELSEQDLAVFDRVAGTMNRQLGYTS